MKNTRGEPSAGGQTAPRETSLSSCLFIPCRSLHCGTRCKHSNYAQVAPAGRTDGIIPPIISTQPIHFFGQQRPE